jgi:hypothetical protein
MTTVETTQDQTMTPQTRRALKLAGAGFALLTLAGLLAFRGSVVQDFPDIELPIVTVEAGLPGAAPALLPRHDAPGDGRPRHGARVHAGHRLRAPAIHD